jgi:hypothetical protein
MRKQTSVAVVVLLCVVAFVAGLLVKSRPQSLSGSGETQQEYKEKYEALQTKFDQISKVDFQEYLKLKDQEARYKKADEILGKILLIMLYDLGIHSSETQLQAIKNYVTDTQAKNMNVIITPDDSQQSGHGQTSSTTPSTTTSAAWKKETSKVLEISTPQDAADFLEKVKVDNLFDEMKNANPLSPVQYDLLRGEFNGVAKFWDVNVKSLIVKLNFEGRLENGKPAGRYNINVRAVDGKGRNSTSNGSVGPDTFMGINGDSQGIMIEAGGGDLFFQLYFFPKLNEFYGLLYEKEGVGKFSPQGVVRLVKK